jgi:hypothetical protein
MTIYRRSLPLLRLSALAQWVQDLPGVVGNTGPACGRFRFQIMVFVAVGESITYTDAMADDLLDDIEAIVRGVIRSNPTNAAWSILRFAGQESTTQLGDTTRIVPVKIAGKPYNLEIIQVDLEVYDA